MSRQVQRRASSRGKTKKILQLQVTIGVLILVLVGTAMGWILAWTKLQVLESEALQLDSELRRVQEESAQQRRQLVQREKDVVELVEKRIPGLKEIEYNKLIEANEQYLLNFTIAEFGTADDRSLEFIVLVKNETNGIVLPKIKIYLFDEFGLQAGVSRVEKRHATSRVDFAELSPGESRSYHTKLEIERGIVPRYYMMHVE